jgi:uncharacterized protein (DUF362 family)
MGESINSFTRRRFLQTGLSAACGLVLGRSLVARSRNLLVGETQHHHFSQLYKRVTEPARVSLVKGDDRYEIVRQSLQMIENEVLSSIGNKQILLKPNVVLANNPLADTHVDAVRAVLDFLRPHYKKTIVIGEAGHHKTFDGYKNMGYLELENNYNVRLVDLNQDSYEYRYVFGAEHRPLPVRIAATFFDPNAYIVSVARMKTHNYVFVTLSLKNVLLGCPIKDDKSNDKALFHTAPPAVNDLCHFNMFHLAQEVFPDLAVIDGFEGMEGNGPAWGTPFPAHVALASRDALAADTLATKIMGFDPKRILYLAAMNEAGMGQGELDKINVVGAPLDQCLYKFKPNEKMAELYDLE